MAEFVNGLFQIFFRYWGFRSGSHFCLPGQTHPKSAAKTEIGTRFFAAISNLIYAMPAFKVVSRNAGIA
jgi:hypothetical protein